MDAAALAGWLEGRLTSEAGRADARRLLEGLVEGALDGPLAELLPEPVFARSLDALLDGSRAEALAKMANRLMVEPVTERLGADPLPVGRHLDPASRARIEALVLRWPLDPEWVDVAFSQRATEALFAETLVEALRDFSERIPAVVQGLAPAPLRGLAGRLQEAAGGVGGRMRDELQRRLEPEIRRFVQAGTRRLLDGAAHFVKTGMDREGSDEARRSLLGHALDRSLQQYLAPLDEAARADLRAVLEAVLQKPEARAELKAEVLAVHRALLERAEGGSIRDLLSAHQVVWPRTDAEGANGPREEAADGSAFFRPDYDAWLDALWPAVVAGLSTPRARAALLSVATDLLEALGGDPGGLPSTSRGGGMSG